MATSNLSIESLSEETRKEQALISREFPLSQRIRRGDEERISYGGRTVEIPKIDHAAMGRPVDKQYERNRASVETRLNAIGVYKATVVNCLPIELRSDACLHPLHTAVVPPAAAATAYATFVFDEAFIEPARVGADAPMMAWDHHPIELATEFVRKNHRGVMSFMGIPSDLEDEAFLNRRSPEQQHNGRTYGEVLEATKRSAADWMNEKLRQGNDDERLKRQILLPCKYAARRLHALGRIKAFPTWCEENRDVHRKVERCPKCQQPAEDGAVQCTGSNCGYILNPRKAYEINAIGEDDPSLERLDRVDVVEMGISDYVAETADEKKERLDRGGIKPQSKAAMRVQRTQDQVEAMNRQQTAEALKTGMKEAIAEAAQGTRKAKEE